MEDKKIMTYAEYKLFSLMSNSKPHTKNEIGMFVETSKIEALNTVVKNKNDALLMYRNAIEILFEDGCITQERITEICKKIGFDPFVITQFFSLYGKESITKNEFINILERIIN